MVMDDKRREIAEKRKAKYTQIVVTKDVKAMIDKLCEKSYRSRNALRNHNSRDHRSKTTKIRSIYKTT